MFKSIERSWKLAQQSWALLMKDRELLLFPILSGVTVLLVLGSLLVPTAALGLWSQARIGFPLFVPAFFFYFVSSTIVIFFNAAMVSAVQIRMRGGDPTLMDGLRGAWRRIGSILGYAAIAATVGLLLRMLRERGGLLGRVAAFFGGLGWALATYVAIPVLVAEGVGPIDAIQRSARLIRNTWGHQVAGHVGFGVVQMLVGAAILLVSLPLIVLSIQGGFWPLAIAIGALGVAALVTSTIVFSALTTVYQTAVHRYAVTGDVYGFDGKLLEGGNPS